MNLTFTVLEIVAPVFLLAVIGFIWIKLGFEYNVQFVTRLAMSLSVPCLIFVSLMKTEITPNELAILLLASFVTYGIITVFSWFIIRGMRLDSKTYLAPIIFGNTGNLGLPLSFFAFGQEGLGYAVVVFAVMAILSFTYGIWLVTGGGSVLKILKEPLIGATFLGVLFLWRGWETPTFLTHTLELLGQIAIPVMLLTLGVTIGRLVPRTVGRAIILSILKAIVCALTAAAIGMWFNLNSIALGVLIVQMTTPVAVTSYLIAEKYNANANDVASLVIASTALSVFVLPLILIFVI